MIKKLLIIPIKAYKYFISPLMAPSCRFHPSCSDYAEEAIEARGAARGVLLATGRLLRCNPLSDGGFDPVPRPFTGAQEKEV